MSFYQHSGSGPPTTDEKSDSTAYLISVDACRKLLGKMAENMSDSEIETLREQLYAMANVVIDAYEANYETRKQAAGGEETDVK